MSKTKQTATELRIEAQAALLVGKPCPNCGVDMMYDPCPGVPRGDGPPPPMARAETTHCDICDQICCDDSECRQMCQSNYCRMLLCKSCALRGGEWIFCPPHLRAWREEEARRIEGELEDLFCQAEEIFGKNSPEVAAIDQARNVLRKRTCKAPDNREKEGKQHENTSDPA